jgi:hypothetical protein
LQWRDFVFCGAVLVNQSRHLSLADVHCYGFIWK